MRVACCALEGRSGHKAGRWLLSVLYRHETGEPMPEILRTDRGKPYFKDSPLHFSITHTKKHAFCVLSCRNVGIDAEELDRRVNLRLAEKILSPGELRQFMQSEDRKKTLLTFWVLKEAQVKLTGEGLQGYPNHTDFTLPHEAVREVDGCLLAILEEKDGGNGHAV